MPHPSTDDIVSAEDWCASARGWRALLTSATQRVCLMSCMRQHSVSREPKYLSDIAFDDEEVDVCGGLFAGGDAGSAGHLDHLWELVAFGLPSFPLFSFSLPLSS